MATRNLAKLILGLIAARSGDFACWYLWLFLYLSINPGDGLQTETEPIGQVICGGKVSDSGLYENKIICKIPPLVRHLLDYITSIFGQSTLGK